MDTYQTMWNSLKTWLKAHHDHYELVYNSARIETDRVKQSILHDVADCISDIERKARVAKDESAESLEQAVKNAKMPTAASK